MENQNSNVEVMPLLADRFVKLALAKEAKRCTNTFMGMLYLVRADDQCTIKVATETVEAEIKAAAAKSVTETEAALTVKRELRRCLKRPMSDVALWVARGGSLVAIEGFPPFRREDYE